MSRRSWQTRIEDALEAIANIQSYVEGMDFSQFSSDKKTIRAAAYEIGVLGEASRHIPKEIQGAHPAVPWQRMAGIRNVVIHEYFRVDVEILWKTIQDDLPALATLLRDVLDAE